jgi:hypothetical protein
MFQMGVRYIQTKAKLPRSTSKLSAHFTKGANSILKNFPCPRVYDIADHACVSLKEVFLIFAGHGARFNFRWLGNGKENMDGLNGTQAMDALVKEVQKRMQNAGVAERAMKQTKIGYLLFWSDSFLNSFIKQKDNSVWVLTVTICPPQRHEVIWTVHICSCHWEKQCRSLQSIQPLHAPGGGADERF